MKETIKNLYKKANKYNANNERSLAIEYYNKVLDLDKNNVKTLKELGELYEKIKDNTSAINCYKTLLHSLPNNDIKNKAIISNQIGICYNNLFEYETAITYFKQVIKIKNDIPDVYNNVYACYLKLKQYKLAEITLHISLKFKSDNNTIKKLGFLYNCLKDYDKSLFYYNMMDVSEKYKLNYTMSFVHLAKKTLNMDMNCMRID